MFDLLVYAIVAIVVLWLRSDSQSTPSVVEAALPEVTPPVIADPWISDITPVLSTVPTPVVSAPQLLLASAVAKVISFPRFAATSNVFPIVDDRLLDKNGKLLRGGALSARYRKLAA